MAKKPRVPVVVAEEGKGLYLDPEAFIFSTVIGVLTSILLAFALRTSSKGGGT